MPKIIVGTIIAGCAVLALLAYVSVYALSGGGCEYVIRQRISAPTNGAAVIVYEKQCGATVQDVTALALVPEGRELTSTPNDVFFLASGKVDFRVHWLDDKAIAVTHTGANQIYRQALVWSGVRIDYRTQ